MNRSINPKHSYSIRYNGEDYSLRHMFARDIVFDLGEHGEVTAFCVFSNHCYTESVESGMDITGKVLLPDDNGNERYFCPIRYEISLQLEDYMRQWPEKHSFYGKHDGHRNFLMVEYRDVNGDSQAIKVAYEIKTHKSRKGVSFIRIESMHPYDRTKPPTRNTHDRVKFGLLLKKSSKNLPLPNPSKKKGGRY